MANDLKVVTDNPQTLINAEKEIERLKCRVARLEVAMSSLIAWFHNISCNQCFEDLASDYERASELLNESPQQSLNAIRADAVESVMPDKIEPDDKHNARYCLGWNDYNRKLRLLIGQLRNG